MLSTHRSASVTVVEVTGISTDMIYRLFAAS